jgi:hypothetical protein
MFLPATAAAAVAIGADIAANAAGEAFLNSLEDAQEGGGGPGSVGSATTTAPGSVIQPGVMFLCYMSLYAIACGRRRAGRWWGPRQCGQCHHHTTAPGELLHQTVMSRHVVTCHVSNIMHPLLDKKGEGGPGSGGSVGSVTTTAPGNDRHPGVMLN